MTFKILLACDQFLLDTIVNCFEQKLIRGSNLTACAKQIDIFILIFFLTLYFTFNIGVSVDCELSYTVSQE